METSKSQAAKHGGCYACKGGQYEKHLKSTTRTVAGGQPMSIALCAACFDQEGKTK